MYYIYTFFIFTNEFDQQQKFQVVFSCKIRMITNDELNNRFQYQQYKIISELLKTATDSPKMNKYIKSVS